MMFLTGLSVNESAEVTPRSRWKKAIHQLRSFPCNSSVEIPEAGTIGYEVKEWASTACHILSRREYMRQLFSDLGKDEDDSDYTLLEHENILGNNQPININAQHPITNESYLHAILKYTASETKLLSYTRLLLLNGVNVNLVDNMHRTAAMIACTRCSVSLIKLIITQPGVDVCALDGEGRSLLMYAVNTGNKDSVKYILQYMSKKRLSTPFKCDIFGNSAADVALNLLSKEGDEIAKFLEKKQGHFTLRGNSIRDSIKRDSTMEVAVALEQDLESVCNFDCKPLACTKAVQKLPSKSHSLNLLDLDRNNLKRSASVGCNMMRSGRFVPHAIPALLKASHFFAKFTKMFIFSPERL